MIIYSSESIPIFSDTHTHIPHKICAFMLSSSTFAVLVHRCFYLVICFFHLIPVWALQASEWVSELLSVQIIIQKSIEHKNININYKSINNNKRTNVEEEQQQRKCIRISVGAEKMWAAIEKSSEKKLNENHLQQQQRQQQLSPMMIILSHTHSY